MGSRAEGRNSEKGEHEDIGRTSRSFVRTDRLQYKWKRRRSIGDHPCIILSKDWGLAHDCSAGAVLRILRGRISNTIDGWNGEILRSLCGRLIVSAVRLSGIAC